MKTRELWLPRGKTPFCFNMLLSEPQGLPQLPHRLPYRLFITSGDHRWATHQVTDARRPSSSAPRSRASRRVPLPQLATLREAEIHSPLLFLHLTSGDPGQPPRAPCLHSFCFPQGGCYAFYLNQTGCGSRGRNRFRCYPGSSPAEQARPWHAAALAGRQTAPAPLPAADPLRGSRRYGAGAGDGEPHPATGRAAPHAVHDTGSQWRA